MPGRARSPGRSQRAAQPSLCLAERAPELRAVSRTRGAELGRQLTLEETIAVTVFLRKYLVSKTLL